MTKYVAAFIFSFDGKEVLLIRKNRPFWQAGLLNAIGGHIEEGETDTDAARREVAEEAGLNVFLERTVHLTCGNATVQFYRGWTDLRESASLTDEKLEIHKMNALPLDVVDNIKWLLPLSADPNVEFPIYIKEIDDGVED